ncbi:NUDIX hydrolase [Curtobacterium sp. SGAir0471]|uniref:NUDIX hydrolase n=1 Tax=Curtobacterium sp. SGAir0471 TaxID=2070337 RepID=UPI0010CD49D9|nr:NUDIX domain-containing protein [Curtobacterium sp. SGAir0471]QCR43761.1 NUDIX hydrolase [Curtobacterium sp. SGAir0471]
MRPAHALAALDTAPSPFRERFSAFVSAAGDAALDRDLGPEHLTASCFVFSPDRSLVLLCLHRKGRFWVQFGGHLEPQDQDLAGAARREAREESGVARLELDDGAVADLDRHDLHGGFSCTAHWDVGFVATVDLATRTLVSHESDDVRWFPVDALPEPLAPGLSRRLAALLTGPAAPTGTGGP